MYTNKTTLGLDSCLFKTNTLLPKLLLPSTGSVINQQTDTFATEKKKMLLSTGTCSLGRIRAQCRSSKLPLLHLVVLDGTFDGVLCKHRAVQLNGRK